MSLLNFIVTQWSNDVVLFLDKEKRKNTLLCTKLSMAAINMVENAEGTAGIELLMRTYISSAVLLRTKFGMLVRPFMV